MNPIKPSVSRQWLAIILLIAVALHLLIVALYVADVIPQQYHAEPFWFHHGGDDYEYVRLARDIRDLEFTESNKYPLGFPLLIVPFMLVMDTVDHHDLLPVVAAFWTVVMYALGQAALLVMALDTLRDRRWAAAALVIWTLIPLLVFGVFRVVGNASVAETYSVHQTWAQMLSDGPATLFTLLSFMSWLILRRSPHARRWAVLLGFATGFLVLVRFTGILVPLVIGVALLLERRWRAAVIMALTALVVFSPQLVYHWHFFDSPFRTGYTALDILPDDGLFNLSYLADGWDKLWNRLSVLTIPLVLAGGVVFVAGVIRLARLDRVIAGVLGLWSALHVALYAIYYYSWIGGMLRFLMPVIPVLVIIALAAVWEAWTLRTRLSRT